MLKLLDLDVVGDFLVMAATLMQIKSKMLLPPDPNEQVSEEEDPREELVRRLLEYKKFKEAADDLRSKETVRQDFFRRTPDEEKIKEMKEEATEVYFEANLFDLISAFANALKNVPKDVFYEVIKEEFTVEQKIHDILHLFLHRPKVFLAELFAKARSKDEIIVTFMAILELIRLREVVAMQKGIFSEIEVIRNKENIPISFHETEEMNDSSSEDQAQDKPQDQSSTENNPLEPQN
jgi:segregation and condensation protein A